MHNIEHKLIDRFERHLPAIGFVLLLVASLVTRWKLLPFYSGDMNSCLLPWTDIFRREGLAAFAEGVGDYSIAYLLLLAAIGRLTAEQHTTMVLIKLVSILFDYAMAAGAGLIVWRTEQGQPAPIRRRRALLSFAAVSLLPLVMLNSALWGQCDSLYACFGVWSVYCLMRERYVGAFVLLGLGLCVKLQMIFLLPLFVILYFVRRGFSILHFFIPVLLVFLSGLPATANGAPWTVSFDIYRGQTGSYQYIFINYAGLPALIQDERYEFFSTALILLALLVCFAMLALLLYHNRYLSAADIPGLAAWSVMACVLFLPSMHERYAYAGEVLAVIWALIHRNRRTAIPAAVFVFTGYCCYAHFLFHFLPVPYQYLAILNIAAFLYLSHSLISGRHSQKPICHSHA